MEKVGIFGGTFNPVQVEHVEMVKKAVKELKLNKLIVVPTYVSPHKIGEEVVDGSHRVNMLKLAFEGQKEVEISSYELDKGGVSYTYETILHFKSIYADAKLYYLLGSDMLENFPTWKNPQIICDNATLVLTSRLGSFYDDNYLINNVKSLFNAEILKISFVGGKASSTLARTYNKLGLSLEGLVHENVANYIKQNNLYAPNEYYSFVSDKLTEKRKKHTAMVIDTALKLRKNIGVSKADAELAALLHDVAKYLNYKDYSNFNLDSDVPPSVIHQFLGAYVVENELKIDNMNIINAVKYHTTGRPNMSNLEKLIFIADLIEPTRSFEGVEKLREAVFNDFESGFNLSINELYNYLLKTEKTVYHLTKDCAEFYN